jgi:hypothetical protein
MIDSNKTFQFILSQQGLNPYLIRDNSDSKTYLLCSECFINEGLKRNAFSIGNIIKKKCIQCNSKKGAKLNKADIRKLCYSFFVRGTIEKEKYGGSPIIQFNEYFLGKSEVNFSKDLAQDAKLIEKYGELGMFYYGPRLWMLGKIRPLKQLQIKKNRDKVIDEIIAKYPKHLLYSEHYFYRLRINPKTPDSFSEYDSPPNNFLGKNRFDEKDSPILYGSPDLDLCIHECRVSSEDNIFVSKLYPSSSLKILNLCAVINEPDVTEFESLDLALHFLFLAGKHSYHICRRIAQKAKESGFDGIMYPSYFSNIRTGTVPFDTILGMSIRKIENLREFAESQAIPNLALFGRPIKDEKVKVASINKLFINQVHYETSFGPASYE